jgi:hypothetical protein
LIFLAVLLLALGGCRRPHGQAGEEAVGPKKAPDAAPEPKAGVPVVLMPGDRVNIELTVFHPPFMYLTGEAPVRVFPPTVQGLSFPRKQFQLEKSYFPMVIPFAVTNGVNLGPMKLQLAAQITFAYKSDDKKQIKNVLIDVPFTVIAGRTEPREKTVRAPVEYLLETKDPIEQSEVK